MTVKTWTVRQLCEEAFSYVDLDWQEFVRLDARFMRPAEVDLLVADPRKSEEALGWRPTVDFRGLVRMMVDADMARHAAGPVVV